MRRRSFRSVTKLAVLAALIVSLSAGPAGAAEFPSWEDVENARSSESAKQARIEELSSMIAAIEAEVGEARSEQARFAAKYETAQAAVDEATYEADLLRGEATVATDRATLSKAQAGRLAASLSRSAGGDMSVGLMLQLGGGADLLYGLGAISMLGASMDSVYSRAVADANEATALTAQADVARSELAGLAQDAEATLRQAAQETADLEAKLEEQRVNTAVLESQLQVLREDREATERDFQKGEEARAAAEAAARARAAAEAAARARPPTPPSGGSTGPGGWTLPLSGWISSVFGPRPARPAAGVGAFHYGTDIAASCGRPVYAAASGTVDYANWLGTYGNWVLIDHGGGVQTGYAHNFQLLVVPGEYVEAGQAIALVGNTGASSGCHLHFEVRQGAARIDPQPFMQQRGVNLG